MSRARAEGWQAEDKARARRRTQAAPNIALERTGHTTGFFQVRGSVGCGPPLTGGVSRTGEERL